MLPNTPLILLGGFLGAVLSIQAKRPKDVPDYLLRVSVSLAFAYLFTVPLCLFLRARYDWLPKDTSIELATAGVCGLFAYAVVPFACSPRMLQAIWESIVSVITRTTKEKTP